MNQLLDSTVEGKLPAYSFELELPEEVKSEPVIVEVQSTALPTTGKEPTTPSPSPESTKAISTTLAKAAETTDVEVTSRKPSDYLKFYNII